MKNMLVPAGVVLVLSLIGCFSYALREKISVLGSFVMFFIVVYGILTKTLQYVVFPGSFWYYRAGVETRFCVEIAERLLKELDFIEKNLESFEGPAQNPASYYEFLTAFRYVNQVRLNLIKSQSDYGHNKQQDRFLKLIMDVCSKIEENPEESQNSPTADLLIENSQKQDLSASSIKNLKKALQPYTSPGWFRQNLILLSKKPFGDLNYMRSNLESSMKCTQIWVPLDDGCSLDCLYIKNQDSTNNGTVLYCNANAELYEYSLYQNEWISYYCDLGLNVIIWNYRGYGRSSGTPSIKRVQLDGEMLVNTMKTRLELGKIAVHGESLGGSFACYLAKKCELDYLFADRTFASIKETAFYQFGSLAYWLVRVFSKSDCDTVTDYLGVKCYKVIATDPNDEMIPDLASLKSGVALRFVYPNYDLLTLAYFKTKMFGRTSHIIEAAEMEEFVRDSRKLFKHDENNSDFEEFLNKFELIDACGKTAANVVNEKFPQLAVLVWLITLDLWGSASFIQDNLNSHMKVIDRLGDAIEVGENSVDNGEDLSEELVGITKILKKMLEYFEEKCGIHGELEDFTSSNTKVDYAIVGRLIPLNCGHCGSFSYLEKTAFSKHFQVFLDSL